MSRVLACDLGKTGCRVALVVDGVRRAEAARPGTPGLAEAGGGEAALASIVDAAAELGATLDGEPVEAVAAGLAGLAQAPEAARRLAAGLADRLGGSDRSPEVALASDMTAAHLGALAGAPGVVVAAGTGAVALAVAASGDHTRVDGWGQVLGDAGSGYDVARRGLALALADHDGRGGSPTLRALAAERYGDLDLLPATVHGSDHPVRTVAAFAPDVRRAAETGDTAALALWARAGADLAATAAAAARRLGSPRPVVSTTGGLFSVGPLLTDPFTAELGRLLPDADLRPPVGDALDGAHLMALRDDLPHTDLITRLEAGAR